MSLPRNYFAQSAPWGKILTIDQLIQMRKEIMAQEIVSDRKNLSCLSQ